MRTTIRVDDELLSQAKQHAARTGQTLTAVIEQALRRWLGDSKKTPPRRERVRLPTNGGRGLQPGVDLDNSAALLDIMEGID